jgi:hypothetical protein
MKGVRKVSQEEANFGGLRLNIKVNGIDEALVKLDLLNELLREANSLVSELANSKIDITYTGSEQKQGQEGS